MVKNKLKYLVVIIILILLCLLFILYVISKKKMPVEIKSYFNYDWLLEYQHFVDEKNTDIDTDFYFADIDDDNKYELLRCVHINYPYGVNQMSIYDYIDNEVVLLGTFEGGSSIDEYSGLIDNIPDWIDSAIIKKEDGALRYIVHNIQCSKRDLFVSTKVISNNNGILSVEEIEDYASYTLIDDGTVSSGWSYKINNKYTDSVDDWKRCISEQINNYSKYSAPEEILHTKLNCMTWLNLYSNETELNRVYNTEIENAIKMLQADDK